MPDEGEFRSSLQGVSETTSEEATAANCPCLKKDICHLERIQRAAAKWPKKGFEPIIMKMDTKN